MKECMHKNLSKMGVCPDCKKFMSTPNLIKALAERISKLERTSEHFEEEEFELGTRIVQEPSDLYESQT